MANSADSERSFDQSDIEASLRASLSSIYGENSPLIDPIKGYVIGSLVLGLARSAPEAENASKPKKYAEQLIGVRTPAELEELVLGAYDRLVARIPNYLSHENGMINPFLHRDDEEQSLIGRVWIWPNSQAWDGTKSMVIALTGGPDFPFDPLGDREEEHYRYSFSISRRKIFDPIAKNDVEVPFIEADKALTSRNYRTHVPLSNTEKKYVFDYFSEEGTITKKVMEQLDAAIDWYENVYAIAPNGVSYGKVKELGYVDETGELLPDWFELMKQNHFELL